jgi:hypothetical protein
MPGWVVSLVGLCMVACASERRTPEPRSPVAALATAPAPTSEISTRVRIALVACDSAERDEESDSPIVSCMIEVSDSARVDTIAGITASAAPALIDDSVIVGLAQEHDTRRAVAFRYSLATREVSVQPYTAGVFEPALSPDGRYFATFESRDNGVTGVLQQVPGGQVLMRTPAEYIEGTDMLVGVARWLSSDSVSFYIQPDSLDRNQWVRFRSKVPHAGWLVDTIIPH